MIRDFENKISSIETMPKKKMSEMFSGLQIPANVRHMISIKSMHDQREIVPSVEKLRPILYRAYTFGMVSTMLMQKHSHLYKDIFTKIAEFYDFYPEYNSLLAAMKMIAIEKNVAATLNRRILLTVPMLRASFEKYHIGQLILEHSGNILHQVDDEYIAQLFYDLSYWYRIQYDEDRTYNRYIKQLSNEKYGKKMTKKLIEKYAALTPQLPSIAQLLVHPDSTITYKIIVVLEN